MVSGIDTASDEVVATVPEDNKTRGLVISGDCLYKSDQSNNRLQMIDLKMRIAAGTISLGKSPKGSIPRPMAAGLTLPLKKAICGPHR